LLALLGLLVGRWLPSLRRRYNTSRAWGRCWRRDNWPRLRRLARLRESLFATNLAATSYTDRPAAGTHTYTVRARDAAGNLSTHSVKVSVTAAGKVASSTPSVPTNLKGKAQDKRYVQLSWGASSGGSGSITYRIFRNDVRIATGVSGTSYRDRAPTVGNHTYKVRAVDSKGNKSAFTPRIRVRAVRAV
jgi:hypothetical protein